MVNEGLEDVKRGIHANHILQNLYNGSSYREGYSPETGSLIYKQIFLIGCYIQIFVNNTLFFMQKRTAINTIIGLSNIVKETEGILPI